MHDRLLREERGGRRREKKKKKKILIKTSEGGENDIIYCHEMPSLKDPKQRKRPQPFCKFLRIGIMCVKNSRGNGIFCCKQ